MVVLVVVVNQAGGNSLSVAGAPLDKILVPCQTMVEVSLDSCGNIGLGNIGTLASILQV